MIKNAKVDILDLVEITITKLPPQPKDPKGMGLAVDIVPLDKNKQVIFDEDALKMLNHNVTEKAKQMQLNAADPNTYSYIKEFIGRMVSELYRNGLVELEVTPDAPEDPYSRFRKLNYPKR